MSTITIRKKVATNRKVAKVTNIRRVPGSLTEAQVLLHKSVNLEFEEKDGGANTKKIKAKQYQTLGPSLNLS